MGAELAASANMPDVPTAQTFNLRWDLSLWVTGMQALTICHMIPDMP